MGEGFVKRWEGAPAGFFEVEAAGLRWLGVEGGVRVAEVVEVSGGQLTTRRLESVGDSGAAAEGFGRGLAVMHDAGARYFGVPPDGWDGDGFIGTIGLPHAVEPMESWGGFYANLRLRPYLRAAYDRGTIDGRHLQVFETVCRHLEAGAYDDPAEGPCRIHGDLWSGNVLWCPEGVYLIDPAAHGGHRETDLAMLGLFGLPRLETVLRAYDEARPLADGWRERVGLHQLHPLLVHVALFGAGYVPQTIATAQQYC